MTSIRRNLVTALGAFVFIAGILCLLGWLFNLPRLNDWDNDGIITKANTSLCAIVSGLALIFSRYSYNKWFIRTGGVFIALMGGLSILQNFTGLSFGIDTLFFPEQSGAIATTSYSRMGSPASLSFAILGMAFLFSTGSSRARHWATRADRRYSHLSTVHVRSAARTSVRW